MRLTECLLALLIGGVSASPLFAADVVGVQEIRVPSPERGRDLAVTLWYPSHGDGRTVTVGDNRIFVGEQASRDATLPAGRHPLILLSHGSGSRVEGMTWIATRLAEAGFVVAGPNPPGTTSGDSLPAATPNIWERTQDLSDIISSLAGDARWREAIDPTRIGVLGFSLGGTTAMELAGARGDLDAYARYCDDQPEMMDCRWFKGRRGFVDDQQVSVDPVDLRSIDRLRFERSNRDARVVSVVAVDPGLATSFQPQSLGAIDMPVTLINLGRVGKIPIAVLSQRLATQIRGASYAQVDDADHFSFLPLCKPGAADFLKSVGDPDPICNPTPGRTRADIHAELSGLIIQAFKDSLTDRD